jgi:hypothetical protein
MPNGWHLKKRTLSADDRRSSNDPFAASQGWLIVQDDMLPLTTAGLAAA